jgi:hypothetical protein
VPERITFTPRAADRIARAVRKVEAGDRKNAGLAFAVPPASASQEKTFRVCTFTGSWSINDTKTVTFRNVTNTPNTVSAMNLVCGLAPTAQCDVSIAKDGTAWYLVQPNLTQQPGYSTSGTQVMTIVNGSLQWIGVSTCGTATASP